MNRPVAIAGLLLVASALAAPALAQRDSPPGVNPSTYNPMAARLERDRVGDVESGLYTAGDGNISFTLEPYRDGRYLLRFPGSPENFVLTVDRGSLGARTLKYDTGATAIHVSVWGGMTLYTQDAPGGLPVTRQADVPPPQLLVVSAPELQAAMGDEASHMIYVQRVTLHFSADPSVIASDSETRGRAFDTLTNAARGIERFIANTAARLNFTRRVHDVKVTEGARPTVMISGQTLLVSFVPGEGHEGHASSLAIQQELGKLLPMPKDVATK